MITEPEHNETLTNGRGVYPGWKRYLLIAFGIVGGLLLVLILSIVSVRWFNPPFTSYTLQEDWEELGAERYNLRDYWVPEGEIPEHLKWAVIASEDQRFWNHWGFDWEAIDEALGERSRGERQRGASTITQQTAKNLYLWPTQSFIRKGLEAGIAFTIELFWPKERILEVYLNIAEFGPGLFGVGKTSQELFGVTPELLVPDAAARMAAVLPSPKRMRVEPPSPFAKERSQWILRQMTQLTGISYVPEVMIDTTAIENDLDPLPWDFDVDLDLTEEIDTIEVNEDSLIWDDIPDSLLIPDWQ